MWHNNQDITALYSTHGSKVVFALFSGTTGWKRLASTSNDGVTNVASLLSSAKAFGKNVNVYLETDDTVSRALVL